MSTAIPTSKPAQPQVAIVSVTYNRCEPLLLLLTQLLGLNYEKQSYDVFLVDNASADQTAERVKKDFPAVNLIRSDINLGTSAGFNLGIKAALKSSKEYEFIWLLDSDAELESSTLTPIITAMQQHSDVGIIGSTVFDPDHRNRQIASGLYLNWHTGMVSLNKISNPVHDNLVGIDLIPACSLVIRSKLCRELGLWDERFWVYWGDTDWCLRITRAGYRVCCHPRSRVWHRDWANTQRNFNAPTVIYDDLRGALLFNVRHNPGGSISGAQRVILKGYIKGAMEYLTMRPNFNDACIAASQDFLNADFRRSDQYTAPEVFEPRGLEESFNSLKSILPDSPTVLLDRIPEPTAKSVRRQLSIQFPNLELTERTLKQATLKSDFNRDYGHYLWSEIGDLWKALFLPRYDLVITDIGLPHLSTFAVARHVLFVNGSESSVIRHNRRVHSVWKMLQLVVKGFKLTYIDLPRSLKKSNKLQQAVTDYLLPDGVDITRSAVGTPAGRR